MDNGRVKLGTNLSHTCPKCSAKFPHSGLLVQHMKEAHPSFVEHAQSRIPRNPMPVEKEPRDTGPYRNTSATCPFCSQDCQTRKKLMRHLELEHKDDNDHDEEAASVPEVKVIRLDDQNKHILLEQLAQQGGSHNIQTTSGDSAMVRDLLKVISSSSSPSPTVSSNVHVATKPEPKTSSKFQYKCFWCDASFRKRGKLMDHIDLLHKHNKQQNQVEAEMLNHDETGKTFTRQGSSQTLGSHTFSPPQTSTSKTSSIPHTITSDYTSSQSKTCSFQMLGSLKQVVKPKPQKELPKENLCKFYFGKKGNPIVEVRTPLLPRSTSMLRPSNTSRRYSLPNMLETTATSTYPFYHRMITPTSMAALQQSYMLAAMRPPMMTSASFYQPRMPLMVPPSDFMLGQSNPVFEQAQAQFLARMNAMRMATSPRPNNADSPLDLTKHFV